MKIKLKEAWISKEILYSHGDQKWGFHSEKPPYTPENFLGATSEHVPGEVRRIMYVEVEDA